MIFQKILKELYVTTIVANCQKKSQGVFLEKIWEKYLKQEKHRKVSFHFSNPWAAGIGWGVQDMRLTFISNNIQ
ncbi:hypothetical protein KKA09_00815 [Patescibacteria group bacterium]|nr:hypothetical protein [Patescibacteria group bacterium]